MQERSCADVRFPFRAIIFHHGVESVNVRSYWFQNFCWIQEFDIIKSLLGKYICYMMKEVSSLGSMQWVSGNYRGGFRRSEPKKLDVF